MKVAIVAESFLPAVNGVTNSVLRVLEHLERRGHEALVVAAGPGPTEYAGARVVRVPAVALPMYRSFPMALPTHRVETELRDFGPDVVHLASPAALGAIGAAAARRLQVPTIAVFQSDVAGFAARYGLGIAGRGLWAWLRRVHAQTALTLAPSSATTWELERHGIGPVARWGRGVDAERFHPRYRSDRLRRHLAPNGETIIGYLGRLATEKQVHRLAHVADLPGCRLVLIGDGPARRSLERRLPGARFLGFLTGAELSRAVASLDVCVHTGTNETFCQAVQEALAAGVPVVAPATGGPLDLVRHGENGWLFPAEHPAVLRSAVAALAADPAGRTRMGEAARASVVHRTWPAVCDELLDHYRTVADPGTADRGARRGMRPSLVVSVHDVAPSTFWATRWWANELDRRGLQATYLAVPGPWEGPTFRADRELAAWLRARVERGDEVAQHGWTHRGGDEGAVWRRIVGSVAARGSAEFWALDEDEARRRLERGRAVLRAAGLDPQGFTPPGWLASLATVRALRELGYRYTTSHLGVTDLASDTRWRVPALSQRPAGAAEPVAAATVALVARHFAREGRSVRVALHPGDLARHRLVACTLRAIDRLVDAGARPQTYLEFVTAHSTAATGRAA